jgi:hypothetical protein
MKYKIDLVITGVEPDGTESYRAKYLGTEDDTFDDAIAFLGAVERTIKREDEHFIPDIPRDILDPWPCDMCNKTFLTARGVLEHRILDHAKVDKKYVR